MAKNPVLIRIFLLEVALSVFFGALLGASFAFASDTIGNVDGTYKYAWGENIGWVNFDCDECDVAITDSGLTGYAWSSNFGWINLNPDNSGVSNDGEGTLSGYAWASNLGWINFSGVTIGEDGEFEGFAAIDSDASQINFNCANGDSCASADFKVKTDWRPAHTRSSGTTSGSRPSSPSSSSPSPEPTAPPFLPPIVAAPVASVVNNVSDIINSASDFLSYLFGGKAPPVPATVTEVPKIAPLAFRTRWNLLPVREINAFVFAPLPYEIRILAGKFPELDRTFKEVGIERLSDLNKLTGITLNVPGLADVLNTTIKNMNAGEIAELEKISGVSLNVPGFSGAGGMIGQVGVGKIAMIEGLPLAKFSLAAKNNLPTEFVFARASGELVDLNVAMSVGERGEVTQKISSLPGKTMKLVVKPISAARSVTGYIVFRAATPKISENSILRSSLVASALFSMVGLVEKIPEPIPVEQKLVLSSFEYTDPDRDGIYTADVTTPSVPGEYEIITVIDYIDPVLGSRKMSMIAVIDPEGYIFEENDGKETRIPSAIVSLYRLNTSSKQYELWPAENYQQENPQITDIRGTYSFLVPAGTYYFHVEAPGYEIYQGKAFVVAEGNGIHQNIELKSSNKLGWLAKPDWQTVLLIVVLLLLVYNLYRNTLRDKLLKLSNKND